MRLAFDRTVIIAVALDIIVSVITLLIAQAWAVSTCS